MTPHSFFISDKLSDNRTGPGIQICAAPEKMWDTSYTNHTSTPSKEAFLEAHKALSSYRAYKSNGGK